MQFVSDCDVWSSCPTEWAWIYDKLIIAKHQNIVSGPAGVSVPKAGWYIVRPITNIRMMSRGAKKIWLELGDDSNVPDGFFWSEVLTGDHVSVDYHWGKPVLAVQGFRQDPDRLDRFSRWIKIPINHSLPIWLESFAFNQQWINVEYIGNKIIEIHLRYNDDFSNHSSNEIIPQWIEHDVSPPDGNWSWYESPAQDRLGFWIKNQD